MSDLVSQRVADLMAAPREHGGRRVVTPQAVALTQIGYTLLTKVFDDATSWAGVSYTLLTDRGGSDLAALVAELVSRAVTATLPGAVEKALAAHAAGGVS